MHRVVVGEAKKQHGRPLHHSEEIEPSAPSAPVTLRVARRFSPEIPSRKTPATSAIVLNIASRFCTRIQIHVNAPLRMLSMNQMSGRRDVHRELPG